MQLFTKQSLESRKCMKEISIIVPIYNIENYLEKCLQSILNQNFQSYEVILVNDGSTDNSREIAEKYVALNSNLFRLINQENKGLSEARNTGINAANGKYICFVDSDDYIENDYLQKMYETMQHTDADMVFCAFRSVDETGNCLKNVYEFSFEAGVPYVLKERKDVLLTQNAAWNKLYKKSIIDEHQLYFTKGAWYEDLRFVKKYVLFADKFAYCDKVLYNYLIRTGSIMNSMSSKRNIEILDAVEEVVSFYREKNVIANYQDEIEFLAIDHIYISALVRLLRARDMEQFEAIRKGFVELFPNYRKNKYIHKLERNRKIVYFMMNLKVYGLIRLFFELKEKKNV